MFLYLFIFVIFLVAIIIVVVYLFQDRIIFHPEKLPKDYQFEFTNEFEEINLTTDDENILNGLLIKSDNSKGLIIYYHNHSANIEQWSRSVLFMNKLDYDVLLMDYRGFGKSTGKYNEKTFLSDSMLWYSYALDHYSEESISLYGRGVGTTFATYVASLNNPKRLCLESPIYSLYYVAKSHYPYLPIKFISKYKFETNKYIVDVSCKIYIFHGKQNKFINYKNSLKLYELSKGNMELLLIPDADHYNMINNAKYLNKITEICKK
jgi:alpha/beta superfamily hydrolase